MTGPCGRRGRNYGLAEGAWILDHVIARHQEHQRAPRPIGQQARRDRHRGGIAGDGLQHDRAGRHANRGHLVNDDIAIRLRSHERGRRETRPGHPQRGVLQ